MHRSLGNTHHTNFPPMPGQAWDLPGLIVPPGHTAVGVLVGTAVPGSGLGSWGGDSTVGPREPQLGCCTSYLLPHAQMRTEKRTGTRTA